MVKWLLYSLIFGLHWLRQPVQQCSETSSAFLSAQRRFFQLVTRSQFCSWGLFCHLEGYCSCEYSPWWHREMRSVWEKQEGSLEASTICTKDSAMAYAHREMRKEHTSWLSSWWESLSSYRVDHRVVPGSQPWGPVCTRMPAKGLYSCLCSHA